LARKIHENQIRAKIRQNIPSPLPVTPQLSGKQQFFIRTVNYFAFLRTVTKIVYLCSCVIFRLACASVFILIRLNPAQRLLN
jgi:hypothetical protein